MNERKIGSWGAPVGNLCFVRYAVLLASVDVPSRKLSEKPP
jgi:hypothetical protein